MFLIYIYTTDFRLVCKPCVDECICYLVKYMVFSNARDILCNDGHYNADGSYHALVQAMYCMKNFICILFLMMFTLLIFQEVISRIEKAYDAFLAEFPLCYGYWKKYADLEGKLGFPEKIVEVYERAVKAVAYSVDIWMHYCSYAMEKFDNPEKIRRYDGSAHRHLLLDILIAGR